MRILVTNDDGIYAPGLLALQQALVKVGRTIVVAPLLEQSAVGHGITLSHPLRVMEVERDGKLFGYGVTGLPADCVKLALREILDKPPDFVVSGINVGANVGINVLYSGTVAAAIEGSMFGIPSIAASVEMIDRPEFDTAAAVVRGLVAQLAALHPSKRAILLNVNVPSRKREDIKGIRVTRQSRSISHESYDRRTDPRGRRYYWITAEVSGPDEEGTDVAALQKGYVSVTPLQYDLTDYELFTELKNWDWSNRNHEFF